MIYLNCHTWYSLRYGTFSVEKLCELAREFKVESLALTDINNTSACLNFIKIASEYGIKPMVDGDFWSHFRTKARKVPQKAVRV